MAATNKSLTYNERCFVAALNADPKRNATRAYMSFSTCTVESASGLAADMLARPHVASYVEAQLIRKLASLDIDADYVLKVIKGVTDAAAATVKKTINGVEMEYPIDSPAALKGAEMLGKHLKMFVDRQEVSGPNGGPIESLTANVELTREQLIEEAAKRGLPTSIFKA